VVSSEACIFWWYPGGCSRLRRGGSSAEGIPTGYKIEAEVEVVVEEVSG
jgi:hypothetical protein